MRLSFASFVVLSSVLAACGGSDPVTSVADDPVVATGAPAPGASFGPGASSSGEAPTGTTCAASAVEARLAPLALVFMIDRSGSMGGGSQAQKWDPVVAGLKSFLSDAKAEGVSASLSFFPQGSPDDKPYCAVSTYQVPSVSLAPLPSAAVAGALDKITPTGDGTPGAPALQGALSGAAALIGPRKAAVAVVYVTDGDPNKCSSTPASVSAIAASYAATVPTYVIGIGSVATLDQIAKAGGTNAAQIVTIGSPTQTRDDLLATIAKIRGAALPCELDIPMPPAGQKLDFEKVNLSLTTGGATSQLANVKSCGTGQGWQYDDPAKPTKLVLCPATCAAAKNEGKLSVTFGCATQVQ